MAKKSLMVKANRKPKFGVRAYNRCCVRELALTGQIPGVTKASW